jgi:hypothetical protein
MTDNVDLTLLDAALAGAVRAKRSKGTSMRTSKLKRPVDRIEKACIRGDVDKVKNRFGYYYHHFRYLTYTRLIM